MGPCSASADGRGVFAMTPNGQLKMPQLGNYCVTVSGEGVADTDVAQRADITATSSNAQHPVEHIAGALMRLSAHSSFPAQHFSTKRGAEVQASGLKDKHKLHVQASIGRQALHLQGSTFQPEPLAL